ncbi:MAG: CHAT domain-containing protein [Blastocatellia bacterium]
MRERAALIVMNAYAENPTAANRHALGKYYLADKQFDKAIEQFNSALKETPNLAELHNDLGAALLEKSKYEKRNNQPGDSLQHMAASLESIEQALKLQPNYPAAVFNRALCLQEMYLPRQAIEEWKKYLQLDGKSPWAEEARRRLAELEKAPSNISKSDDELYQDYLKEPANDERTFDLFCQSYSTTGNGITERLIDDYLAAQNRGDAAAATDKLNLLEQLGKLIYQRTTDPYVRDVAQYYRHLPPSLLPKLTQARHHLNEGRKLRTTSQSQAVVNYEQAIALFRQAQDQCEVKMTTCLLARSHLRQLNLNKSRELFEGLIASNNSYLWLCGESLNGLAEYYHDIGQPDDSIRTNQSSLVLADQINNTSLVITCLGTLAFRYSDLGNWEQALLYQQLEFDAYSKQPVSHQQYWYANGQAAVNLFASGFRSAALVYQREALHIEQMTERPLQLSRSYAILGTILGKDAGDEAILLLKNAVGIGAKLKDESVRQDIQRYSWLHLANLQRKLGDFSDALQSYGRVVQLGRQLSNPVDEFETYRGKAISEIALGLTTQAKQDLSHALATFERNRNQIFAEKERTTFFDKEYEIYEAAIGFAYADRPKEAFDLSEKSRARSLLEILKSIRHSAASSQPLDSLAVQRKLTSGTYLLEFTCLPDRLLVWGISSNQVVHHQQVISLPLLEQKVQTFLQALTEKTPAADTQTAALSAELYQLLIEPLEPFLDRAETVCIVPDKMLFYLPFAALFSARQQKYLVENYAITTAPSATVFLLCVERARRFLTRRVDRLLVVGNPRFDHAKYPQLANLAAAENEASEVAKSYLFSRVLNAEQATEQAVKAEFKRASILHFATHGVLDLRSSSNSRLLLTKPTEGDEEDGALRAYEIDRMRLSHVRLAVLSACQSGIERFYRGEGLIGLGRAFLAAGVPTVVASYWPVDSDVTALLMTGFHQQFKTYSASQALRRAQLDLLHHANPQYRRPYYWAAFSAFGGNTL